MITYYLLQLAQGISAGDNGIVELTGEQILQNALNIFYFLAGAVAVIVIVVGGLMYAGSGGNAQTIIKAKGLITYAVVGLITVGAAFAITNFVIGAF